MGWHKPTPSVTCRGTRQAGLIRSQTQRAIASLDNTAMALESTTAGQKQKQQNGTLIESFLWLALDNDLLVTRGSIGSQGLRFEPASQEEVPGGGQEGGSRVCLYLVA